MNEDTEPASVAGSPVTTANATKPLGEVIQIDQALVQKHLGEVVRSTVEETLNALLDAEADRLCGAKRYERSPERVDTRAGHYERQFHTQAGEVTLKMPKLRSLPFETAIIERYKRRETSLRRRCWRCITPACRCAGSRTSPRRCGGLASAPRR